MPRILIVDDTRYMRGLLRSMLEGQGHDVLEAPDGHAALDIIERERPACVLTDLAMPKLDGFGLLDEMARRGLRTPAIVVSADVQRTTRTVCLEKGALDVLSKPPAADVLHAALARALHTSSEAP